MGKTTNIEKKKTHAKDHQRGLRLREVVRGELRNSERRIGRRIKRAAEEEAANRKKLTRLLLRGKGNAVGANCVDDKEVRDIARMIVELHERLSGTSSDIGEQYTFKDGSAARLLLDVKQKLAEPKPAISKEEAKAISLIYEKFFPEKR